MKQDFTAIAVIMDASGSMGRLTNDTIGSFNTFLNEQKVVPGEAAFSLCTFNTDYRLVHDFVPLTNVAELTHETYRTEGSTALLDAMGTTIDSLGAKLAAMPEEERPSRVVVLVLTDGEENASHRFTLDQIKDKVTHQREVYNWQFVYIGANVDAFAAGTSMGFSGSNSVGYVATVAGTDQLYRSVSSNLGSYRRSLAPQAQIDFFSQTGETPTTNLADSDPVDVNSVAPAVPATPVKRTSSAKRSFNPGRSLPKK